MGKTEKNLCSELEAVEMRIYKDAFSGDEIISDSYEMKPIFDGVGYEVRAKNLVKGGEKIDIGCGNAFGAGGGEEQAEEVKDETYTVLDLLDTFHYQETTFSKSDYVTYIKGYMKKVKGYLEERNPSRVEPFMKGAQEMVKWIVANFDKFSFYAPESYDQENIIILSYKKEEDHDTPTFLYFADALKMEKY
eukprot:TRINITY_DN4276_c0_g1_i1.p1 TRINITY_DN4276_c0_g1~~TRINITY_DN4276_c0_g1_i1.p1  ORF type:complete len:191 (+),score=68.93 TRINITY_DN4276_c0_g1_i1:128-700(+)